MSTPDRRAWIISFFFLCAISLVIVSTNPPIFLGENSNLESALLCSTVAAIFLLVRSIRQLRSQIKNSEQLNIKYLHSLRIISEIDTQTRREISFWLHGDVQRQLINLARTLKSQGDNDLAFEVSKLNDETVRAMAHRLHPQQLDISLELALSDLCHGQAELQLSDNLQLHNLTTDTFVVLQSELRIAIYRIIEEGISNALKKPSTRKISVLVTAENKSIDISIQDDGDRLIDNVKESLGFSLIEIFVEQFGGRWSISNNEDGVLLRATLRSALISSRDYTLKTYPKFSQLKAGDTK